MRRWPGVSLYPMREQTVPEGARDQMRTFDKLGAVARAALREAAHDFDVVDLVEALRQRGLSTAAGATIRSRGKLPCDLSFDELVALEVECRDRELVAHERARRGGFS